MATANLEIIVDADGHIVEDLKRIVELMPRQYREVTRGRIGDPFPPLDHLHSANLHELLPGSFRQVGPEGWVEFLHDVGIEATVLYPTRGLSFGKIISRHWAVDLARAYNDWLYETYIQRDPRFKGIGLIPMQEPPAAALELRRIIQEYGFVGAMLPSLGQGQSHLGHPRYWPIYEEANRLGCCLGVHGGAHEDLGMNDLNPYAPVHALGHPFGQMIGLAGIVFNGIPDKFPNVRFGFMEGGAAWILPCLERFDRSWETHIQHDPNDEFIPLRSGEKVSEYILRHIQEERIFIGCEGSEPDLAYLVKRVGNKPFMFSTDFPHEVNNEFCKEEIHEILDNPEMTAEDKAAILHRNAQRFYGLRGSA